MQELESFKFSNSFADLPEDFFHKQNWTPFDNPKLIHFNKELAELLGFPKGLNAEDLVPYINGNKAFKHSAPLSMAYAGHQFGSWVPQLGDGRGILLGQIRTKDGLMDLHIKGAGKTPYSRFGDGRAVLRSTIREYLCGEAMHHLGIPSSRSLIMIGSDEPVFRETTEFGAMMVRVAKTHIRFGHFEYLMHNKKSEFIPILLDHVIESYFPDLKESKDGYTDLFEKIVFSTAGLIAKWQAFGFAHGVMNTDNCSIAGETIDYGPCAFLDKYSASKVFSSIDTYGRYAYSAQADVIVWNMAQLANALLPIVKNNNEVLNEFNELIQKMPSQIRSLWLKKFGKKIGITKSTSEDLKLISGFLNGLASRNEDFTISFRKLIEEPEYFKSVDADWYNAWESRTSDEPDPFSVMASVNPNLIPRNHQIEFAISSALNSNFEPFHRLNVALKLPYEKNSKFSDLELSPTDKEEVVKTFCGT